MIETVPPLLALRHWTVRAGGCEIIREVSFTCRPGEQLAVVGPNGSGKSTLLRSLAGLIPGSGSLQVCGEELPGNAARQWARKVAFVPQILEVPEELTVREFLKLGRYAYHPWFMALTAEEEARIEAIITDFGLQELLSRKLGVLSGGERQRVLLAGALVQEAKVLVLDEPTSALDPNGRELVWAALAALRRRCEIVIVVATHDLNAAALHSSAIFALKRGDSVFSGSPKEFMTPATLEPIFGNIGEFVAHPRSHQPMVVPPLPEGIQ